MDSAKQKSRPDEAVAIVAITRHGVGLALQLQARMPGSRCYVPMRHRFALAMGAEGFEKLSLLFPEIWPVYRAFVCIMSTGIVVRQIAPLLRHKTYDPAVVVLDEKGQFAISLVSGHLGGANRLAEEVAGLLGAQAVITTASDVRGKPALDMIAREAGLEMENIEMLSRTAGALLEDEPISVYDPEERLLPRLSDLPNISRLHDGSPPNTLVIWVSELAVPAGLQCMILRPRNLVVGVGCNRGTPAGEILDLLKSVFERAGISTLSIRNFASIDIKSNEAGILEAAEMLRRPVHFYSREEIEHITVPTPSDVVAAHIGVQSVCEATALLSSQAKTLTVPKQKTPNVTLAVARVDYPS